MNTNNLHSERYKVLTFLADFDCSISIPAVLMLLQEAAWHHANDHDLGYDGLRKKGLFWVLSRLHVKMLRYPRWTNEIRIETWSKQPDILTAYRDFEGFGQDDSKFLQAASSWLILDHATNRPQPLGNYAAQFPHLIGRHAIEHKPSKIAAPSNPAQTYNGIVQPSDIDMHQHVNNTRYAQWVLDSFGFEFLKQHAISSIEINFLSQAKQNDAYSIATSAMPDGYYVSSIINKAANIEMARIRTSWQSKK
jgi:acyl-ACP thioesterase